MYMYDSEKHRYTFGLTLTQNLLKLAFTQKLAFIQKLIIEAFTKKIDK